MDVVSDKCIWNDAKELSLCHNKKLEAWVEHYSRLPNIEFNWPSDSLVDVSPVAGPAPGVSTEAIFVSGPLVPKDWEESYILNLYKGKGVALDRGNYRSLKLTDLKVVEHVLKVKIREMKCSLISCLERERQMLSSSQDSFKKNLLPPRDPFT